MCSPFRLYVTLWLCWWLSAAPVCRVHHSFFFCYCRLFVCFVFIALLVSRSTVHVVEEKRRAAFFFFYPLCAQVEVLFFFFILEGAVVVTLRLVSLVRQSTGGTIEKNWSQLLFFLFFFFLMQEKGEKKVSLYIYACVHVRVSIGISNFLSLMIVVLFVWFLCFWPPSYPFSLNFFLCFTC